MDAKQCMIVDLERRDDKRMFITEQVASISENKNGLWCGSCPRPVCLIIITPDCFISRIRKR